MVRHPPDVLITTPESLYLMLTSQAREIFTETQWVIVDEIHAVAQTKRGAHLAITLERLAEQADRDVQRIGLSATQNPLEEVARFMVGPKRTCTIVDTGVRKPLDLKIHVPVESMREPDQGQAPGPDGEIDPFAGQEATRKSIWPAIYPELLKLVREHRSTIVFVNNRRGAERLALRLNELAAHEDDAAADGDGDGAQATWAAGGPPARDPGAPIARAHHGSLSREERLLVEDQLKAGDLPCLVATSSLELGIDMGAVDLVLQVESPKSVTAGLQRIGRAGHNVGDVSKGRIFPKFRADLLECAVVAQRMREAKIESTVVPRNPLDVLAQQVVAMAASAGDDGLDVDGLHTLLLRTYTYAELSRAAARERARHARRPLSLGGVRRPAPADRVGPRRRLDPRPPRRPRAGDHQRRHDPGPRLVLGQHARRPPRGRARRGDGLRGPARPDLPAGRERVADRGDHPRPGDRLAGAGRARPPCRSGAATASGARASSARRSARSRAGRSARRPRRSSATTTSTRSPPATCSSSSRAGRGHPRAALGPHDRHRALPGRDRRLAHVHPLALRRARARRLGRSPSPPASATSTASSPTPSGPTTGSSSTCPTPTSRRAPTWC